MEQADQQAYGRFLQLVQRQRPQCLWFLREDYVPSGPEEVGRVLAYLERYGDRETFLEARRLSRWLSRDSSATSAGS